MFRNGLLIFWMIIFLPACGESPVFERNIPVEGAKWDRSDVKTFEVHFAKPNQSLPVYILVRNTGAYSYSNLWLFVSVQGPGGREEKDTLEFRLASPDGHWIGKRAAGLFENKFLWQYAVAFPDTGVYIFHFEQAMRNNELKGIQDVGLYISQRRESSK